MKYRFPVVGRFLFITDILISVFDFSIRHEKFTINVLDSIGISLFVIGLVIYVFSRFTLRKYFSEKLLIKPGHKLITKGIYNFIRHPIYLGEILLYISVPIIFSSIYGLIIAIVIIYLILYRIKFEEKLLISRFGQEYLDYSQRTKKLIPFIF